MSQLTLKCEKFGLSRGLQDMLTSGDLVDVTLACQGQFIQAHKTVLAACSPHFRAIFKLQTWQQPIVFMHDVELAKLEALVDFMYNGEVTVNQKDLAGLLKLADALKVTGLAAQEEFSDNETQDETPLPPPPPAKIARRSFYCDISTRISSPEVEALPTSVEQINSSQVNQAPLEEQSWLPDFETIGTIPQTVWEPSTVEQTSECAASVAEEDSFDVITEEVKLETEEFSDVQDHDVQEDSYLDDQSTPQDDLWYETVPFSNEPNTSKPAVPRASTSTVSEKSTSTLGVPQPSTSPISEESNSTPAVPQPSTSPVSEESTSTVPQASTSTVPQTSTSTVSEGSTSREMRQREPSATSSVSSRGLPLKKIIAVPQESDSDVSSNEMYFCDFCNKDFKNEISFNSHIKKFHRSIFNNKNKSPQMLRKFVCQNDSCGENFRSEESLKQHVIHNHNKIEYFCDDCDIYFNCKKSLQSHVIVAHVIKTCRRGEDIFKCDPCAIKYGDINDLYRHYRIEHPKRLKFICRICKVRLSNCKELRQHKIDSHEKDFWPFICKLCGTDFKTTHNLKQHLMLTHDLAIDLNLDKTRARCEFCFENFSSARSRTEHMSKHHPELCLGCRLCPLMFGEQFERLRHELDVHRKNIDNPELFFPCDICNYAAASQCWLLRHMKIMHNK